MKLTTTTLALLATTAFTISAAQASITINSTDIKAVAHVYANSGIAAYSGTVIPTPEPAPLNVNRSEFGWYAESRNTVEFSENSGQTTLLITIDHHEITGRSAAGIFAGAGKTSSPNNDLPGEQGTALRFTTDVDTPYELSGIYEIVGTGDFIQTAMLVDVTTSEVLFYNWQQSHSMVNEALTLGESILIGSLSGQLLAGHTYDWHFAAFVGGFGGQWGYVDDAKGNFKLVLGEVGDPGVVPEATSFLTWGLLGLTGAVIASRRRKRQV